MCAAPHAAAATLCASKYIQMYICVIYVCVCVLVRSDFILNDRKHKKNALN